MEKFGVGQAVRRREDERFITGAGSYIDDLNFENVDFHVKMITNAFIEEDNLVDLSISEVLKVF